KYFHDSQADCHRDVGNSWTAACEPRPELNRDDGPHCDNLATTDRVWRGTDSHAIRLWRLANSVFRRRRSARTRQEPAARIIAGCDWGDYCLPVRELCVRAGVGRRWFGANKDTGD